VSYVIEWENVRGWGRGGRGDGESVSGAEFVGELVREEEALDVSERDS
jgi:hypothetical protein